MLPNNYNDEDAPGIRRDILVEGRVQMNSATSRLQDMFVQLDSMADDPTIWSDEELETLREMQGMARELMDSKEDDLQEVEKEMVFVKRAIEQTLREERE